MRQAVRYLRTRVRAFGSGNRKFLMSVIIYLYKHMLVKEIKVKKNV
ncbi:hypothetical protein L21SP2_2958 [Salinispira pacifica]|uniref:Uncharacterized protein n=1 Tax=Salinispira pacifica TaxID=1307761 RepID=V5WL65_9SPIO|nr:hypothetical protein L21SP2_2958 [Salinispira pacifica]